ncbi:MAG: AAA family ATPase, partial [Nanoarchaeota archaeon]|nr:AAA family ATPase [Nanoarchaeota archaeon]
MKTIGIISLKGGVGKTSIVVALGSAIADFGKSVLLIDGNLSAP